MLHKRDMTDLMERDGEKVPSVQVRDAGVLIKIPQETAVQFQYHRVRRRVFSRCGACEYPSAARRIRYIGPSHDDFGNITRREREAKACHQRGARYRTNL